MSRRLFTRIADDLAGLDPFFTQRPDARNYEGFTTLQKCTAAIRQLAYGTVADALDEYLQMSARTTRECLSRFCHNVVKLYSKKYLRKPNTYDVQQFYQAHEARHGFPGMLRSIDCMHWAWHNCPNAWRCQYTRGDHDHPTLILEAVASQDLWICILSLVSLVHSTTSTCYTNRRSLAMSLMEPVRAPVLQFLGLSIDAGIILLTEYICLSLQLSRLFHIPMTKKGKKLPSVKMLQEKTSNVLLVFYKKKWAILEHPARAFTPKRLRLYMYACILLHNMIIEDESRAICEYDENASIGNIVPVDPPQQDLNSFSLTNDFTHANLQQDLVEHIWNNVNVGDGDEDEDEDEKYGKSDPVMTSWRFDKETDMVTVIYDCGEQEDYLLENLMTKQGIGFMEELHNATCLNTDMDSKMALMQDIFKWRLQNLQQQEADESEGDDMDESLDEDSEEEDNGSDGYFLDKVPSNEEF
ncbi:uncharacterized protein LOC110933634 [Helianthus annuus]|uniref:uncharacterized protein LOC110933634 n=1 Tax=Helianthus annuus TaxID=4232 RepID=UPI000B8FE515|nr:uncharacterized protein LOC110933634 [Helianthus annuus]